MNDNDNDTFGQKDLLSHEEPILFPSQYAGFWLRVGAYLIDAIILRLGLFLFVSVTGRGSSSVLSDEPEDAFYGLFTFAALLEVGVSMAYFCYFESSLWQATPGKRALGIKVTTLSGQRISIMTAVGRMLGKFVSAFILAIGFLMAGFTEKKQALHDMIASTLVVIDRP
jgi:uncharacterized RDD family membrane protein YckC